MAAMNYVVTVQRPTAVTGLATGHFTSSNDFNLILAKNTHIEIYIIGSEGLKLVKDVCIYGEITILKCFRLPVSEQASIRTKRRNSRCALYLEYEQRYFIYFHEQISWYDLRLPKE